MEKQERRFNHWVDAHEKELRVLMNSPEKWNFCVEFILTQNGPGISMFDLAMLIRMVGKDKPEELRELSERIRIRDLIRKSQRPPNRAYPEPLTKGKTQPRGAEGP